MRTRVSDIATRWVWALCNELGQGNKRGKEPTLRQKPHGIDPLPEKG